jgi:predicted SnoaL-like aldol condensation-catalyzing enzyme
MAARVAAAGEQKRTPVTQTDMFRLEDGRIVEHWDVIQEVPAESANDNGMW